MISIDRYIACKNQHNDIKLPSCKYQTTRNEEVQSTTGEIWRQNLEISTSGQYQKIDINDFYT
jgi:hypothetical protein